MRYLITGGTGTFGQEMAKRLHAQGNEVIIFSRDEQKQYFMKQDYPEYTYRLGDVRDYDSIPKDFDYCIHAAALKIVTEGEENPDEFIKTNIIGTQNVIKASQGKKLLALSTDKAVAPVNLYGATKMILEKLVVAAGGVVARYGNVVGSRGSVVPVFLEQSKQGRFTVTDDRMTRFWLPLEQAVDFVESLLEAESAIHCPNMPCVYITDLAKAINPDAEIEITGIRRGEKLHEEIKQGYSSAVGEFLTVEQIRESLRENKFL